MQMFKQKVFYINLILLFIGFFFVIYKIRFSCIYGDDIVDFFPYNWNFFHGRIFTEILSISFIKWIPHAFNINIQNFAIISESALKAVLYCILVYVTAHSYNKFKDNKLFFPISMIFSFFVICAVFVQNNFTAHIIKMDEYYQGYITGVFFYLLLWYQVRNLNFEDNFCEKKRNLLILFVCGILNLTSNTELTVASIILIFLVLIENLILYLKSKNEISLKKTKVFLILFLMMLFLMLLIWKNPFAINMVLEEHSIKFDFLPDSKTVINFVEMFFKNAILNNIYFIVILLVNFILILTSKSTDKRQISLIIYSLLGFFVFQIATMFCNMNCYATDEKYKFWFLHGGLISDFSVCLYFYTLYSIGYVYDNFKDKKIIKNAFLVISFILLFCYSYGMLKNSDGFCFSTKDERRGMYITDKLSVYYLQDNKNVILPPNLNFEPEIIFGKKSEYSDNEQITVCGKEKEKNHYLNYLNYAYSLDFPECVTFRLNDEALKIYKENGGKLTDEELEKLDFKILNTSLTYRDAHAKISSI